MLNIFKVSIYAHKAPHARALIFLKATEKQQKTYIPFYYAKRQISTIICYNVNGQWNDKRIHYLDARRKNYVMTREPARYKISENAQIHLHPVLYFQIETTSCYILRVVHRYGFS